MNGSKAYFRKLNNDEKVSKLSQFANSENSEIFFWMRGKEQKIPCEVLSFHSKSFSFNIKNIPSEYLEEKNILFTFYVNKVQYFGEGDVKYSADSGYTMDCSGDVYKNEKRESFRLLCYPHHEVYFLIEIDKKDTGSDKVVNIRTGKNENELFDSFMDLMGESSGLKGFAKFRVIDISVTGLALQYGQIEKEFIENLKIQDKRVVISFNGKEIDFKGFEFVYKSRKNNEKTLKAGVRFTNLDINLEEKLAFLINKAMRK